MDPTQYAKTVRRMREAQRAYFKDRTNGRLQTAKELEAIVDRETGHILKDQPKEQPPTQTSLL
jgi:hypothetical protein